MMFSRPTAHIFVRIAIFGILIASVISIPPKDLTLYAFSTLGMAIGGAVGVMAAVAFPLHSFPVAVGVSVIGLVGSAMPKMIGHLAALCLWQPLKDLLHLDDRLVTAGKCPAVC